MSASPAGICQSNGSNGTRPPRRLRASPECRPTSFSFARGMSPTCYTSYGISFVKFCSRPDAVPICLGIRGSSHLIYAHNTVFFLLPLQTCDFNQSNEPKKYVMQTVFFIILFYGWLKSVG